LVVSLFALAALFILVLLRLEAGLLLLAFFIPFFLLPQRIFARSFSMVEILTVLCVLSWGVQAGPRLLASVLRRPLAIRFPRLTLLDGGVLGLAVVGVLSTLQASQQVVAWRELRLVIIEPALLYLVLRTARLSPDAPRLLLGAFVTGAVAIACIGLFNYARGERYLAEFGLPRIKSIFGSANNDALYLARAFPFSLAVTALDGGLLSRRWRLLAAPATLLIGVAMLLTQSRGMLLLGLPAMLVVMLVLAGRRWRLLGVIAAGLAALALIALLTGALTPLVQGTRLANAFDLTRGTGFFRLNLWQSAWRMFVDHPMLGVGPDNFLYAYRGFYILPAAWQEPGLSHPHNVVLDWMTRLGAAGLAAGVALVVGFVRLIRHGLRDSATRVLAIASAGYLAEVLAHGMVDHSFFLIDLMFVFVLLAGVMGQLTETSSDDLARHRAKLAGYE
jgi:O-antigen ligase